jgi:hypothetical protein
MLGMMGRILRLCRRMFGEKALGRKKNRNYEKPETVPGTESVYSAHIRTSHPKSSPEFGKIPILGDRDGGANLDSIYTTSLKRPGKYSRNLERYCRTQNTNLWATASTKNINAHELKSKLYSFIAP